MAGRRRKGGGDTDAEQPRAAAVPARGAGLAVRGCRRSPVPAEWREALSSVAPEIKAEQPPREVEQPCVLETSGNKSIKVNQMKLIEAL